MTFTSYRKKDFTRNNIFFCGIFLFVCFPLPLYHPRRGHGMTKGLFCIPVGLRFGLRLVHHALSTERDSVDSPSGCKVKTLMYRTFANELVCLRNCFFCFNSLLIDSQQLCVFIMWLFVFLCVRKIHRGQDSLNFNWKIYEIYNVENWSLKYNNYE